MHLPSPFHLPDGGMHSLMMGGVPSTIDYELYHLELTEASHQALEESNGASTNKPAGFSNPGSPSKLEMFQDSHGLKVTDSPAKFLEKRPASDMSKEENGKAEYYKEESLCLRL